VTTSYLASGTKIPQRFRTFTFKQSRYATRHFAAGKTSAPLRLRVKERPHGGLHIRVASVDRDVEVFTPAEIIYPTQEEVVVIETKEEENFIALDPIRGPICEGAMPDRVTSLVGLLESRGMGFDMTGEPFRIKDKKASVMFFNDLRDFMDREGRIDHVALLVGEAMSSKVTPKIAAQMIFSTREEWAALNRVLH
jgi:hypothetical protein